MVFYKNLLTSVELFLTLINCVLMNCLNTLVYCNHRRTEYGSIQIPQSTIRHRLMVDHFRPYSNFDTPDTDLPDLRPVTFMESNELLRLILVRVYMYVMCNIRHTDDHQLCSLAKATVFLQLSRETAP